MKSVFPRRVGALLLALILAASLAVPAWAGDIRITAVSLENATIKAGGNANLKFTVDFSDNSSSDSLQYYGSRFKWYSNDPKVTVTNGTVRVASDASAGDVTITAEYEQNQDVKATCTVTVEAADTPVPPGPVAVSGVRIQNGEEVSIDREGLTVQLQVAVTPPEAANKAVQWSSSNTAVATVSESGLVTALTPGETTVTAVSAADQTKSDSCKVIVSGITLSQTAVTLKVNQTQSVEYGGFGRASGRLLWSSADPSIASALNGKIVGNAVGKTTITVSAPGTNYQKTCEVTVIENIAPYTAPAINAGQNLDFSGIISGLDAICKAETPSGAGLKSISSLTVSTSQGIVHYGYVSPDTPNHGVGGSETYYVSPDRSSGQLALSDVKFVPASGFSGTAEITYIGHSTRDETYNGSIQVQVRSTGDVAYSTAKNTPLTLSAKEFKDICQIKTGRSASYITFTQPNASRGTLYYNYSATGQWSQKVDGDTRYYVGSSPSLEKVTFVPAENYTGAVTVSYRCTDTTGGSYAGTMTINVYATEGSTGGSGGVEYTTGIGRQVTLNPADFNTACQDANDRNLSYIYFDGLPNASQGVLYYSYTSSSSSRVDANTRYNRSNTGSRISYITFVPAAGFSGDVTIPYTGYDTAGQSYKDDLVIHVTDAAGVVYYTTGENQAVTFRAEDFNDACQRANGSTLNYLYFDELPSTGAGTLYRNYRNSSSTGTRVTTSQRYSRGGDPSVSDVTFVPRSSYAGTVSIPFTGYDASGARFDGSVNITVGQVSGRVVSYSTASGGVVRFNAGDFNSVCRAVTGDDLEYVSFDLPARRYGTLYYQYNSSQNTGTRVSSSNTYYRTGSNRLLDSVSFAAANTNGTASFTYTARSTGGERFTGTVEIAIGSAASGSSTAFGGTHYIGSAAPISLRAADFESACSAGTGGTLSHIRLTGLPDESAGRLYMSYLSPSKPGAPATLTANYTTGGGLAIGGLSFVPRAGYQGQVSIPYTGYNTQGASFTGNITIDISPSYCSTPFYDVDGATWQWAMPSIEFLRSMGVTNGYSDNTFRPSRSISRGEFVLMICRAFGFDTSSRVSSFPDVPASSVYAGAVATAKSMGIVEGSGGRFNPNSAITRQSAMTMLCRAMRAAGYKVPSAASSTLNVYSDQGRVASYARESVASLVRMGVVQGGGDMRLNPTRSISRAQMAAILHRALTM